MNNKVKNVIVGTLFGVGLYVYGNIKEHIGYSKGLFDVLIGVMDKLDKE